MMWIEDSGRNQLEEVSGSIKGSKFHDVTSPLISKRTSSSTARTASTRSFASSWAQSQKLFTTLAVTGLLLSGYSSAKPVRIVSHAYRSSPDHSATAAVSPIVAESLDTFGVATSSSRNEPHIAISPFQGNSFASNKDLSVGKSTTPAPWVTHYLQPQQEDRQQSQQQQQQQQRQVGGFYQRPQQQQGLQSSLFNQGGFSQQQPGLQSSLFNQGGFSQQQQQPHVLHTTLNNNNAGSLQQQQQQQLLQSTLGSQGSLQQFNNQQLLSQQQQSPFAGSTSLQSSGGLGWSPFTPSSSFPQQQGSNTAGFQQNQQYQQPQQATSLQQQQLLQLLQAQQQQSYQQQQLLGLSAAPGLATRLQLSQQQLNPFLTQSAGLNNYVNPLLLRGYSSRREQKLDDVADYDN